MLLLLLGFRVLFSSWEMFNVSTAAVGVRLLSAVSPTVETWTGAILLLTPDLLGEAVTVVSWASLRSCGGQESGVLVS